MVLMASLSCEDFTADIDGDFLGQIAVGDGDGNVGNVSDLSGQIAGHNIDAFSQVFPNAAHVANLRLAAELAFGADLAGDAGDLGGKAAQLVHHSVDGLFELEDFAADIDGDFLGQVAVGDGNGHVGDVSDLGSEVAGHEIDAVREVFPSTGDPGHRGLTTQFAFGADLPRYTGHLGCKTAQLIYHGVDGVFELKDLSFDIDGDFLGQVAVGDGDSNVGNIADLRS